ncbi:MAG: trans-sulfuration enzyme family protein [Pirellulaceae bacterium]
MDFRTRAIHVGNERDESTGAVVPPIHMASTFVQHSAGEWREFDYSRSGNPTRKNAEKTIANLETGFGALGFSSGMAAVHCATMLLSAGDHLVAGADIYGGTYRLLHKICDRAGINVTLVENPTPSRLRDAITSQTRMIWLESPGNPLMSITDLKACCDEFTQEENVLVAVDNTFATPVLTRPIELGADIVMHSATKYLGGHSDALGGFLVTKTQELFEELYFVQNATGAVMSPMDSFLISRGMKTLDLRVRAQSETALDIANWLNADERVSRVLFPGLSGHPGHQIANTQMNGGFGAMLSFEVHGDFDTAQRVANSTELFQLAVSLGAVESLIEQPASMSHASYDRDDRLKHGISDELIRLSIGLESPGDLKSDLDKALSFATTS